MLAAGQLDQALNSRLIRKSGYSRLVAAELVILALPLLWFDYQIVTEPYQATLPQVDRYQYIEGPWNATGMVEVTAFLAKEQTQANKSVVLFTTQTIPNLGLGLEFYKNTPFKLIGVDLVPNVDYVRLNEASGDLPADFCLNESDRNGIGTRIPAHLPQPGFCPGLDGSKARQPRFGASLPPGPKVNRVRRGMAD